MTIMKPTISSDEMEVATRTVEDPVPKMPKVIRDEVTPEDEREREQAFDASFRWGGRVLKPFSSSRKSLFLQQRVAMGAPDLGKCLADIDGFLADAARILFLCSHDPDEEIENERDGWGVLRADSFRLQMVMDLWTDKHIPAGKEAEAVQLAYRIYASTLVNRAESAPSDNRHGDDLGN